MTTVELRAETEQWAPAFVGDHGAWSPMRSRIGRALPTAGGACLLLLDFGLVFGAFMLAYWSRFVAADLTFIALGVEQYSWMAALIAAGTGILFATHGLFDLQQPQSWSARIGGIVSSISTALVLAVAASYFLGEQAFSRLWLSTGWLTAVAILIGWHTLVPRVYTWIRDAIAIPDRVLIVGANRLGQELAAELQGEFHVVGYVDNGSELERSPNLPLLGPIAQLEQIVQAHGVNEVVIALPTNRREQVTHIVNRGFHRPVTIKFLPELGELLPQRFELQEFGGRRYIGFAPAASVSWIKRVVDLAATSLGLLLISPILLAVAIAIKLDSSGPVFYRQVRVGKNGRQFGMYKFRSMIVNADRKLSDLREKNEASGPLFKMKDDPRVTRVGKFIRRWSLDELPQLFNVMRGEMSLVGPRPPIPAEVDEYEEWQLGRLRAVPGLTGLWQVSGRSEVPFHDMVRLDLHYIRNWSIGLDIEILLRTIPAVLTNRGAY
ncbi:MAG: sugar transferase [Chloroflexi bacterium]|nr:sugar transferase [Chloroflexota bacterium]MBV9893818.1 sugar transferase [Chloroflexota bacterium]